VQPRERLPLGPRLGGAPGAAEDMVEPGPGLGPQGLEAVEEPAEVALFLDDVVVRHGCSSRGVPGPAGRMSRLPGVGDDSPVTQKTPPCPGGVLGPDGAYRSGADGLGHLPAGLVGALLRTTPRLVRGLAEVAAVHVRGPGRGHV